MEALPAEYRHEPALALDGGDDGLDAVRDPVKEAPRFLNPGGTLVVEVGHNRDAAETAFPRLPLTWLPTADKDDGVFLLKREDIVAGASTLGSPDPLCHLRRSMRDVASVARMHSLTCRRAAPRYLSAGGERDGVRGS